MINLGALESSFQDLDAAILDVPFGLVLRELRRKLQRRVAGHSMGRTGKRSEDKIHGGNGAPRTPGSAASSSTAQGVGESAQGRSVGDGEPAHLQMPKSASADSKPTASARSAPGVGKDGDRVHSHGQASTSPRCGFKWVTQQLQEALDQRRAWDDSTVIGGFDDQHYSRHCVEIGKHAIRHVIGTRGRMLRKIEDFCGVFIMVNDDEDCCEVNLLGLPYACLSGGFIVEMLEQGYYSIMEFLARHGW